jgi:DNA-binding transcriptional MerR regulator
MKASSKTRGWYLAREVGLLAGVSGDKIGQWARYGYIRASWSSTVPRIYSFQDVAEAIAVHELLNRGVVHADIRSAIDGLHTRYGDWPLQTAPFSHHGHAPDERAGRDKGGRRIDLDLRDTRQVGP